jgi:hypothetical protein
MTWCYSKHKLWFQMHASLLETKVELSPQKLVCKGMHMLISPIKPLNIVYIFRNIRLYTMNIYNFIYLLKYLIIYFLKAEYMYSYFSSA